MNQLDIFTDNEFQSLDLEQKQSITNNYFDTEIADDEFSLLDEIEQNKIRDNFINAQLDFDISDTADTVMDYFDSDETYTQSDDVTDPSLHDAVAPNVDGTIPEIIKPEPKEESSLFDDAKEVLFGTGEDYVNPDAEDYELGKRLINRTNELTANAIQGTYNLLGNMKSPVEYLGFEPDFMKESNQAKKEWFKEASDKLNDFVFEENKLDVKPTHTWDEVKKGFTVGGVFDADAWQEVGNYILGEGVASLPDMAEMVAMMPLYYASRQQESAEKRAELDGRSEPTKADYLATAPTTIGSIILDKFSLDGMTKDVIERVGKEALDGSLEKAVKVIGSEVKKGTIKEGVTEGIQNPLEKFGEEIGTKHGLSSAGEYADESLAGVVAGAGMGAGMSGTTATGTQVFNEYSKQKQETQRDLYIQDAYNKQMLGSGLVASTNDTGFVEFKNDLDTKVKTIQSEFENLVINNPEIEVPVEAVESIEIQEQIVADAKEQGLDVSSDNGLNAIDKGFKELEAEIGEVETLEPKASEEQILVVKPDVEFKPEVVEEKTESVIDVARLREIQELGNDETTAQDKEILDEIEKKDIIPDADNDTTVDNIPVQDNDKLPISQEENTEVTPVQEDNQSSEPEIKETEPKEVMFKKIDAKKAVRGELVDLAFGLKGVIVKGGSKGSFEIYEYSSGSRLHGWGENTSWKREESIQSANEKLEKFGEAKVKEMIEEARVGGTLANPEIVNAKAKPSEADKTKPKKGQVEFTIQLPDNTTTTAYGYPLKLAEGYDGFVKQDDDGKGWAVTEKRSGLIIKGAKTRAKAIEDANKAILDNKDKMPKMVEYAELQMQKASVKDEALNSYKELDDDAKFNLHRSYLNDNITDETVKKQSDAEFEELGDTTKGAIVEQYIKNNNSFENFKVKSNTIDKEVQEDGNTREDSSSTNADGTSDTIGVPVKQQAHLSQSQIQEVTSQYQQVIDDLSDLVMMEAVELKYPMDMMEWSDFQPLKMVNIMSKNQLMQTQYYQNLMNRRLIA